MAKIDLDALSIEELAASAGGRQAQEER